MNTQGRVNERVLWRREAVRLVGEDWAQARRKGDPDLGRPRVAAD
jgi:hypothetical protein